MLEQGRALLALGCGAVLMKGGHLDDAESPDWLFTREGEQRFTAPRVQTKNTHGTGCTLSAALAALRPRHADWAATVIEAKAAVGGSGAGRLSGGRPRYRAGAPFPRGGKWQRNGTAESPEKWPRLENRLSRYRA